MLRHWKGQPHKPEQYLPVKEAEILFSFQFIFIMIIIRKYIRIIY